MEQYKNILKIGVLIVAFPLIPIFLVGWGLYYYGMTKYERRK